MDRCALKMSPGARINSSRSIVTMKSLLAPLMQSLAEGRSPPDRLAKKELEALSAANRIRPDKVHEPIDNSDERPQAATHSHPVKVPQEDGIVEAVSPQRFFGRTSFSRSPLRCCRQICTKFVRLTGF
jgi:hypothetical protein